MLQRKIFYFDSTKSADYISLESYGVIGDNKTSVLISSQCSIGWACLPDFDSPSAFASILDPNAGKFIIRPIGEYQSFQYYETGTNILVTEFSSLSLVLSE